MALSARANNSRRQAPYDYVGLWGKADLGKSLFSEETSFWSLKDYMQWSLSFQFIILAASYIWPLSIALPAQAQ